MSTKTPNFFVYTDMDGKCPNLLYYRDQNVVRPRAYVRYVNDRPVEVKPWVGQTKAWCYQRSAYIPLSEINVVIH